MKSMPDIGIYGCGACGSAVADVLACSGRKVRIWGRDSEVIAAINEKRSNPRYLPGKLLHERVSAHDNVENLSEHDIVVLALPCQQIRAFLAEHGKLIRPGTVLVNLAKGLELSSLKTPSGIVEDVLGPERVSYVALSGPSFAVEMMDKKPTAVVLGCTKKSLGARLQKIFSTPWFRCYYCKDVIGVELGGALKNVLAIAAGICDGLELGHNARAALVTRGLAEMSRIGVAMGARTATFSGLSGLGDLMLSCAGDLSRNRQTGLRLGRGESLEHITSGFLAEGVKTALAVNVLARKLDISVPIASATAAVMEGRVNPREAVFKLMMRELKEE